MVDERTETARLTFEERGHLRNQMPYFPGVAADTAPPASTCVHCGAEVKPDGHDDWIHARGLYRCQSPDVTYGHLAHPAGVPCRADGPNPCLGAMSIPPGQVVSSDD